MADTSKEFYNKIKTYSEQFPSILDDFKQNYFAYTKYPENNEYQQIYASTKGSLVSINKDIFLLTNQVELSTEDLNKEISNLDKKLSKLKLINDKFKKKLMQSTGKNNSSEELIDNTKELYKYQYISNVTLLLGNFLIIISMIKLFGKKG